jgi:hypothetical protein
MFTPHYLNVVLGDVPYAAMLTVQSEFVDQPAKWERVVEAGLGVPGLGHVEVLAARLCIVREQGRPSAEGEKARHGNDLIYEEQGRRGSCEPAVSVRGHKILEFPEAYCHAYRGTTSANVPGKV